MIGQAQEARPLEDGPRPTTKRAFSLDGFSVSEREGCIEFSLRSAESVRELASPGDRQRVGGHRAKGTGR